jgi:hypothetical protein
MVFVIAAHECLELIQGDFKTAFLTADLPVKTVYMDQPTDYEQKGTAGKRLVPTLLKTLYGLKQASTPGFLPQIV